MPEKPTGKSPSARTAARRGEQKKTRRGELRKRMSTPRAPWWRDWMTRPELWPFALIAVVYVLAATGVVLVVHGRPILPVGRVMDHTRTVRVEFKVEDPEATKRERDAVKLGAPLVFGADRAWFEELRTGMATLPEVLAAAEKFEDVAPDVIDAFHLTPQQFEAIRARAADQDSLKQWHSRIDRLISELYRTPLLETTDYQRLIREKTRPVELVSPSGQVNSLSRSGAINIGSLDQDLPATEMDDVLSVVNRAGIFGAPAQALVERIVSGRQPSFRFDSEATDQRLKDAEAKVQPVMTTYHLGDTIYRAGQTLTKGQAALAALEHEHFVASQPAPRRALTALGILGVVMLVTAAVGGYLRVSYRRQFGRPWRVGAIAAMSLALLGASGWGAVAFPNLTWVVTLTPTIFLAMLLVIAYDRRIALMVSMAQAVLVGIELALSVGFVTAVLIGAMLTGWRLASVRNRNDMVRGGFLVSAGLVVAVATVGLVERPWGLGVLPEIAADALATGVGAFAAAAITLMILPGVERVFDVVTGMTLSELRDPKQPLLRKLQQSAPGTYNHSLNVATLAEGAADAIGADGLHAYVGALYHDIGKMNKPDYFVENQPRGFNRHEKLSPAMSLLVIVGHVKDGMELAREYNLPRSLHHYIESHHGTTLVEYFYDQAKRQADADDSTDRPAEIEYRYPGPRPRTKEAAILMLCDAVESATRAMAEPIPSRIQQLVHALARKRLMDGQFDESNLTLRDLSIIEDSLTKSLCAIYHGRIAYPKAEPKDTEDEMAAAADRVAAEQGA